MTRVGKLLGPSYGDGVCSTRHGHVAAKDVLNTLRTLSEPHMSKVAVAPKQEKKEMTPRMAWDAPLLEVCSI
jgi:hypothetical protein